MKKVSLALFLIGLFCTWSSVQPAGAHVTPNVKLSTTRETVQQLLPEGKLFVKKLTLTADQVARLKASGNWDRVPTTYQFFVSRDQNNNLLGAMVMMPEFTRHGPVVVAVALDAQGTVMGAMVTDIQMEPLEWIGPLLRNNYLGDFKGKNSAMPLALESKWKSGTNRMTQSFALIIANAVKKSAQLFDLAFK